MNEIALVTANFGVFDDVKPLPDHEGIDAFYYTDEATRSPTPPCRFTSWTGVLVPSYPRHDFGPRLRSRYFKHQIHRLDEVRGHRWLVWADSSLRFHEFLRLRYTNEEITEQMDDYRRRGRDLEARLYGSGFWMVETSDPFNRCWDDWWDHTLRFGMMDQLSLPVVLDNHGCAPQILDMDIRSNDHFCLVGHSRA